MQIADLLQPPPKPWYREPWPWLLMFGPCAVIVAGIITTTIAFRSADGLVAQDYYKQGLMIDRVLARERRAAEMHVAGNAWYSPETGRLRLQLGADRPLPPALTVRFVHATRAGMDQSAAVRLVAPGVYEGSLHLAEGKRWQVTVETAEWRVAGNWDRNGAIALDSAAPRL